MVSAVPELAVARDSLKISAFVPQKHQIKMPSDERDKHLLVTRGIIDYGSAFVNRVELAKDTAFVHGQTYIKQ